MGAGSSKDARGRVFEKGAAEVSHQREKDHELPRMKEEQVQGLVL